MGDDEVQHMADQAECNIGKFPFNYLCLPVDSNMSRVDSWDVVIIRQIEFFYYYVFIH